MSLPFIDLTPEVRSELNRRRRQPVLRGLWLGFCLGCLVMLLAFLGVALATGNF